MECWKEQANIRTRFDFRMCSEITLVDKKLQSDTHFEKIADGRTNQILNNYLEKRSLLEHRYKTKLIIFQIVLDIRMVNLKTFQTLSTRRYFINPI